ncbi:hypothetical protein D3C86_1009100 [compost metagenome]
MRHQNVFDREIFKLLIKYNLVVIRIIFVQEPHVVLDIYFRLFDTDNVVVLFINRMVDVQIKKVLAFFASFKLCSKKERVFQLYVNSTEIRNLVSFGLDTVHFDIRIVKRILIVNFQRNFVKIIAIGFNL